jgi:hypothetical protein
MDIQGMAMDNAQSRIMEEAGTAVLAKNLKNTEAQALELMKLIGSAKLPDEPGSRVDILA